MEMDNNARQRHAEAGQVESKPGLEKLEHIEQIGHAATAEEHKETALQAIKSQPWAFIWCIYAIYVLILTSFDNQAGGAILGIPQFRKDFGNAYQGDYVLPANWQSAYSGAPVAS
jgi:SP family general alpha glucoside:H+ symporter-like MFS transporter